MSLGAEEIPEHRRCRGKLKVGDADLLDALLYLRVRAAGLGDTGEIALHIGYEHRHPDAREGFRYHLQSDGLPRAGGDGDQPVAVGVTGIEENLIRAGPEEYSVPVAHLVSPRSKTPATSGIPDTASTQRTTFGNAEMGVCSSASHVDSMYR